MELTVQQRRRLLLRAFKVVDLVWMVAALGAATVVTAYQEAWLSSHALLDARLNVANLLLFLLLAVLWHLIFSLVGLYRERRFQSRRLEVLDVVKATSLGSLAFLNAGFLFSIDLFSPEFLAVFWAVSSGLTICGRLAVRFVLKTARLHGRNLLNVLIVGTNIRAWKYAQKVRQRPELGYRVAGFVDDEWEGLEEFRQRGGRLVTGIEGLLQYLRRQVVDEVVIALPLCSSYLECARVVGWCEEHGVTVRFLSDIFNLSLARAKVELFEDEPIITLHTSEIRAWRYLDFSRDFLRGSPWRLSLPPSAHGKLDHPPGWALRRFASWFFSRKTYTHVLGPTLDDLDDEYTEALAAGQLRKASWVRIRGYWAFWSAVAAHLPVSVLKRLSDLWKIAGPGS